MGFTAVANPNWFPHTDTGIRVVEDCGLVETEIISIYCWQMANELEGGRDFFSFTNTSDNS